MSQHKAASLTSNLFARKGRASPASLLIAELEGVAPEEVAADQPQGPLPKFTGNGIRKLDLNGSAAKKAKAAEPDLPLLAFVEAQTAAEGEGEEEPLAEAPPEVEPQAAEPQAAEPPAAKDEVAEGATAEDPGEERDGEEPRPPASLLDSGARALRKANGRAPAAETLPPAAAAEESGAESPPVVAATPLTASAAQEAAEGEEVLEAETVSGDANVAAIVDAPQDEPAGEDAAADSVSTDTATEGTASEASGTVAADLVAEPLEETATAAEAEVVVEAVATESEEAEAATALPAESEPEATAPAENAPTKEAPAENAPADKATNEKAARDAAPAVTQKAESEKVLSAAVALRQAAALRPEPAPKPSFQKPGIQKPGVQKPAEKSAEGPETALAAAAAAKISGGTLPWRSAAVVALGIALGLGAYVMFSGEPETPPAESVAPLAETTAPQGETAAGSNVAGEVAAPATATPEQTAEPAPLPETAAAPAAAATLPEPSFDIIRIEPDGQSIIAGRATPGSEWILLNNGEPIATVKADANGEWVILPDASLVPGANAFSLVPKTERGKVAIPAPGAAPQGAPADSAPSGESRSDSGIAPEAAPKTAPTAAAPSASAIEEQLGIVLPKPKPAVTPAPASLPAVLVAADGAYELQVASVRQNADAERERGRLAGAFPDLLGALDLRVQEASVEGAGTFFRVRSGAIADLGVAREICRRLEEAGQGCLVVRRSTAADADAQTEVVRDDAAPRTPPEQQAERPE